MKQLNKVLTGAGLGLAFVLGAGPSAADPIAIATFTPDDPGDAAGIQTRLIGSDTMNGVMDTVITALNINIEGGGDLVYTGLGSSQGQRQMEGSPTGSDPRCTPNDVTGGAEGNPGCQEVAPMSRQMNSAICEDDADDPRTTADSTTVNDTAEGLAVCADGVVLIANNRDYMRYSDDGTCPSPNPALTPNEDTNADGAPEFPSASAAGTGLLRYKGVIPTRTTTAGTTTYEIGGGALGAANGWKDVLRVVYFGCLNDQGDCATTPVRVDYNGGPDRCSGNDANADNVPDVATDANSDGIADKDTRNAVVRETLINNWKYIVDSGAVSGDASTDCANGGCTALRSAYRRDDASGTTDIFRTFLGVAAPLTQRTTMVNVSGSVSPPTNSAFCDGGDLEGFLVATNAGVMGGDPIKRACKGEDDLCVGDGRSFGGAPGVENGKMGVVRSIRSPREGGFPTIQCKRGSFAPAPWPVLSTRPICPDKSAPVAGFCQAPFFVDGGGNRDFNCLNDRKSIPLSVVPGTDGRAYNYVWRLTNGAIETLPGNPALPETAQWRQNMAVLKVTPFTSPGGAFPASDTEGSGGVSYAGGIVCQQVDATRNIGCLVSNTTCTLGFAGREAASFAPFDDGNEAYRMQNIDQNGSETVDVAPANPNIDIDTAGGRTKANYPFARDLFLNAIGGFENITADCLARGGDSAYCAAEVALANEFFNMGTAAKAACNSFGYIPYNTSRCVGAATATSNACGAPTAPFLDQATPAVRATCTPQ